MSLKGSTSAWNWFVEASPGQGEKETVVSPEDKLRCVYSFFPEYSGIYSVKVPVQFEGAYRLAANQAGAGGRWAMVRIGLETTITHRDHRHTRTHTILEKKVTKGGDAGPFKHVHHFTDDLDLWAGTKPADVLNRNTVVAMRGYGQFGENLTVEGLADDEVCIGDRYRIGGALFEVTQPRVTCYRVGIRMNDPAMPTLLVAHHRPGFYLRVLEEGPVEAGDAISKVAVPRQVARTARAGGAGAGTERRVEGKLPRAAHQGRRDTRMARVPAAPGRGDPT